MEGFVQIKRHEIHHDALGSRDSEDESEDDSRPRDNIGGETPRARKVGIYLNDCFARTTLNGRPLRLVSARARRAEC